MKKVSAKRIAKMYALTKEYYADVRGEDGNKDLLEERYAIANELENETGVSWFVWENLVSAVHGLGVDATDDEMFCALRVLGFKPED